MDSRPKITPKDFFSNAAAWEAGFTGHFRHQVYQLYLEAVERDLDQSIEALYWPYNIRMPFKQGHIDVVVRTQPEPREHPVHRFTAFPAAGESETQAFPVERWHFPHEQRPVLGEGAMLSGIFKW